jgi:hypothetical protein
MACEAEKNKKEKCGIKYTCKYGSYLINYNYIATVIENE